MSIFSGISEIKGRREARTDAAISGDTEKAAIKPWVQGGFWLICLLAVAGLVLLRVFTDGDMPPSWAFSVGIEAFSVMACAIVYYCYMQYPDSSETYTALFAQLLVADTCCLFLDEVAWLVQGRSGLAFVNIVANALLYLGNCVIVIQFWRHGAFMLQIPERTAHK